MEATHPIAVLGAGSWGSALAIQLARNGQATQLWDIDQTHCANLAADRANQHHLSGIKFPDNLTVISDLGDALADCQDILIVAPSHAFRDVITAIKPHLQKTSRLAWATKGLDATTGKLLSDVTEELLGDAFPLAVLSGPSFAGEVAKGLPTAVALASTDPIFAGDLKQRLHSKYFRVYLCEDLIGLQVCGAVKNVIAVASGMCDGLKLGANARCALITRGLAEMTRLGMALGARMDTFIGLAGVGDLVLTATDDQSRNRRFGLAIGRGDDHSAAKSAIGQVVESAHNAEQIHQLALFHVIEMPITEQVYHILHHNRSPEEALNSLLARK